MPPRSTSDRPPTLATVADACGVSRMTVSNAYNRPDQLSPALRDRILATARDLGYAGPNPLARTLSRGETGTVGLVYDYALTVALTDPATVELLYGVASECEARELGLTLVPRIGGRDAALVHNALVDGFVLYSVTEQDPRLEAVRRRRLPHAVIDHEPLPGVHVVNVDDRGAARRTAEYLAGLGHRRFAIVNGWDSRATTAPEAQAQAEYHVSRERFAGWREGLEAAGIDWATVRAAGAPGFDRATGRAAGLRLLDRGERPTAVMCFSDPLALGVMDAAAERGVAVPQELSVVGFDDVPDAARATPPLTTVRQPHADKGREAVRLTLGDAEPHEVLLPADLVLRSSTASPPR